MSDTTHISETVSAGQLRAFIERIERVEEEIRTLNADKSEIYKELRGCGFDVKAVRQCVAARKLDSAEREERNAIFDLYWSALTGSVHVHTPARENIEQFPPHNPETGELTDTQEQPETASEIPTGSHDQHHELVEGPEGQLEKEPLANADAVASVSASISNPQPNLLPGAGKAGDVPPPSSPAALSDADVPAFLKPEQRKTSADYRPECQHPDNCGSSNPTGYCYQCRRAMEAASETEAAA